MKPDAQASPAGRLFSDQCTEGRYPFAAGSE